MNGAKPSPEDASGAVCRRLRTKTMYTPVSPPPPDPQRSWRTAQYWCQKTMRPLGPDGRIADLRSCVSGRECFEGAHPLPSPPRD